jgi:hypothetical protein
VGSLKSSALAVFNHSDIWYLSFAGNAFHWNGDSIQSYILKKDLNPNGIFEPDEILGSLWGNSSSNLYGAGEKGALARFDGQQWYKLNLERSDYLADVYGIYNYNTRNYDIYSPLVYEFNPVVGSYYRITNSNELEKFDFDYGSIYSIWGTSNYNIFACGTSIHHLKNNKWEEINFNTTRNKMKIRGSGLNNIFVVGGFGFVGHFNGLTWGEYPELRLQAGGYASVYVKDNIVALCGRNGEKGIIAIGISK